MKNSVEDPQKTTTTYIYIYIESPCNPAIPLWEIYPKKMETESQRYICTPMFIAALFTLAKTWNLNIHQRMNGKRSCEIYLSTNLYLLIFVHIPTHMDAHTCAYIYTHWNVIQPLNQGNSNHL